MTNETEKTFEDLQVLHSEMLATAGDLGMEVPEHLTAEFADAATGRTTCDELDAAIKQFRAGLDEAHAAADATTGAEEGAGDQPAPAKPKRQRKSGGQSAKTKPTTSNEDETMTETSKKATAPKKAAKAPAKKATAPKKAAKAPAKKATAPKKAAKKAPAKKATAPKKAGGGGAARISGAATVKVLKKENPFAKGTDRYNAAEVVLKGGTVSAMREKGVFGWIFKELTKRKLIEVIAPKA